MGKGQPRLLDHVRDRIGTRRKLYSIRTEQDLRRLDPTLCTQQATPPRHGGSGDRDVSDPPRLAVAKRVSASTQNQAKSAILFLYKEVLAEPLPWLEGIESAKRPARLPGRFGPPKGRMHLRTSRPGQELHESDPAAGYGEAYLPRRAFAEVPRRPKAMGMAVRLSRAHALGRSAFGCERPAPCGREGSTRGRGAAYAIGGALDDDIVRTRADDVAGGPDIVRTRGSFVRTRCALVSLR